MVNHLLVHSRWCIAVVSLNDPLGEDQDHPATELEDNTEDSKGWESSRFSEFPQTIIIQFQEIVNLQEIQLLCHEFKIPTRIEFFAYVPLVPLEIIPSDKMQSLKFKRIGHISFDSNERTNYSARELKSVYVDFFVYLLKLQVNKCFNNKLNNFKQAGIVSLKCLTSQEHLIKQVDPVKPSIQQSSPEIDPEAEEKKEESIPDPIPSTDAKLEKSTEANIDPITMKELTLLERQKQKAVDIEDFDEALRIKKIITNLKDAGKELWELEVKKKEAIKTEDYEAAKKYKTELERIRNTILNRETQKQRPPPMARIEPPMMPKYHEEDPTENIDSSQSMLQAFINENRMRVIFSYSPIFMVF